MEENKTISRLIKCDCCEREFYAHFDADDIGGMPLRRRSVSQLPQPDGGLQEL